jgi:hypothetical protein
VYIVVFVQLTTIISEYFWFILIVVPYHLSSASLPLSLVRHAHHPCSLLRQIPAFAGYKLLGLVLGGVRAAPLLPRRVG